VNILIYVFSQKYDVIQKNLDNLISYYNNVDKPKLAAQVEAKKEEANVEQKQETDLATYIQSKENTPAID
jgi:hypothetical protein